MMTPAARSWPADPVFQLRETEITNGNAVS